MQKKNKSGKIAVFQISLLLISMFAFAFLVGGMSKVEAAEGGPCTYTANNKIYSGTCEIVSDCKQTFVIGTNTNVKGCTVTTKGCCYNSANDKEETPCGNKICDAGETFATCSEDCTKEKVVEDNDDDDGDDELTAAEILALTTQLSTLKSELEAIKNKLNPDKEVSTTNLLTDGVSTNTKKSLSERLDFTGAKGETPYGYYNEKGVKISRDVFTEEEQKSIKAGEEEGFTYSSGVSFALAKLGKSLVWAGVAYGISYIGGLIWDDEAERWTAGGEAAALGISTYGLTTTIVMQLGATAVVTPGVAATATSAAIPAVIGPAAWVPFLGWGLAIGAAIWSLSSFKEYSYDYVLYTCDPWAAKLKGEDCDLCNEQGDIPCTEYQCRSLGQACELINKEETGEPLCYWKNPKDVTPPIMEPLDSALLTDFSYTPDGAISPPDRGVIIEYEHNVGGKLPAFTPVAFGINTSEPSRCKIDTTRKEDFDSMFGYFGDDASFAFEHTQNIILPRPDDADTITLENGGKNQIYVRCQDPNGNYDLANFVFTYEVDDGPDTTPPLIVTTSILNGFPIAFNESSTDLTVYINEPADCKWDNLNKNYEDMDNPMICEVNNPSDFNAQILYECETILEGLISNKENKFYFRCKDQPDLGEDSPDRNVNMESYIFTLLGTMPLQIDSVKPSNTIIEGPSTKIKVTLEVETSAGYEEGISTCKYKDQDETAYIDFYNTYSYYHTQDLWLEKGDYNYSVLCVDLGGNADYANAVFSVETDLASPIIVRAYYEDGYMKLITSEEAMCVYGTSDCNYAFEDGIDIQSYQEINHFVEWNTEEDLYVKCQDVYENQPTPQKECSIVVRASEYYEAEED